MSAPPARRSAVSVVVVAAGVLLCAHAAYDLYTSPLGSHQILPFVEVLLGAGLVANGGIKLLLGRAGDGRSRAAAWAARIATILVPVFALGATASHYQQRKIAAGKAELDAAVELVARSGMSLGEDALASALQSAPSLRRVTVRVHPAASVVETDAGSFDIDGSTLFVALPQRAWGYFHNDQEALPGSDRERYEQAAKAQGNGWELRCRRADAGWQCQREKIDK